MSFYNALREGEDRRLDQTRRIGFVVQNDDSQHPDGKKLQRTQIRLPELHDETEDKDLPWFTPGGLDAYSGGSDVGSHGPVPPKNAKVYVRFEDDTQYHGQYLAGVAHTDNQIAEFVKPQGGDSKSSGSSGGSSGASSSGSLSSSSGSSSGGQATDLNQPQDYDFTKNYPNAHGHVNQSGDFHGHDSTTDFTQHKAVSGTGWQRDGKGNVQFTVNGNAKTSNQNAGQGSNIPEGFNAAVFGNGTIYLSKDLNVQLKGKLTLNCTGDANVTAKGKATVASEGDATLSSKGKAYVTGDGGAVVSSKGTVEINASSAIHLNAPSITSQVDIVTGGSGSPGSATDVQDVKEQTAPQVRQRPADSPQANDTSY